MNSHLLTQVLNQVTVDSTPSKLTYISFSTNRLNIAFNEAKFFTLGNVPLVIVQESMALVRVAVEFKILCALQLSFQFVSY